LTPAVTHATAPDGTRVAFQTPAQARHCLMHSGQGCQRYLDQMRATLALGSVPVETLYDDAINALLAAFPDRQT
jgi:hypothetical protein